MLHLLTEPIVERKHLHEVGSPGQTAAWQPSRQHLGECAQIGRDSANLLKSARGNAKPGNHLVEDEEHTLVASQLAKAAYEFGLRRNNSPVRTVSFVNHTGRLMLVDRTGDSVQIIGRHKYQVARDALGDSRRRIVGVVVRRLGGRQEGVVPAMEMPHEFHNFGSSRDDPAPRGGPSASPRCRYW